MVVQKHSITPIGRVAVPFECARCEARYPAWSVVGPRECSSQGLIRHLLIMFMSRGFLIMLA